MRRFQETVGHHAITIFLLFGFTVVQIGILLSDETASWVKVASLVVLVATVSGVVWAIARGSWHPLKIFVESSDEMTRSLDEVPVERVNLYILIAAGLTLYFELMLIRWHASCFQLFGYFKNISLVACFLGLGIGYARGGARRIWLSTIIPAISLQLVVLYILRFSGIGPILNNPVPENITLGLAQYRISGLMMTYGVLIVVFIATTISCIPLGQLAARLMSRRPPLVAYSWNLSGSILGIVMFTVLGFAWAPPSVWMLVGFLGMLVFLRRNRSALVQSTLFMAIALATLALPLSFTAIDTYSPYQILTLRVFKNTPPVLFVNHAYFQRILDLRPAATEESTDLKRWSTYYQIPYSLSGKTDSVLILGSGMGNDVAAALRAGSKRVDAVEIDPAILKYGRYLHVENPYGDSRVTASVDDARRYVRRSDHKYDLIVYGLLDSHTLLSANTSVRLDSFVYTVEAFREARQLLTNDGKMVITFTILSPAQGKKLVLMLTEAFEGIPPRIFKSNYDGGLTFVTGNAMSRYSIPERLQATDVTDFYSSDAIDADPATDDWPFFYMPKRSYPASYILILVTILVIATTIIRRHLGLSASGFSLPCFFLGAGFMLLETKGITELGLLFGSTWLVISIVIVGILIMAYLANLAILKLGSPPTILTYLLLFSSIALGYWLSEANLFSRLDPTVAILLQVTVLTVPLFFAGFVFSHELSKAGDIKIALSSNLIGAMVGALLEYNSMYFGFQFLYLLVVTMYAFALVFSIRMVKA